MRWIRSGWAVLVSTALACSGGPAGNSGDNNNDPRYPDDPGGTPDQAATVEVRDDVFSPDAVVVAVGGTVTFTWVGTNGHSVTPTGSPSFSPTAPVSYPPKQLVVTFNTAGTYHYYCIIHGASDGYGYQGNMTGTVVVR